MANKLTERLAAADRKTNLLNIGVTLARTKRGLEAVTRAAVAEKAGVTQALINHYFDSAAGLRWAVIEHCAAERDEKVIASALALGYRVADVSPLVSREVFRKALHLVPKHCEVQP